MMNASILQNSPISLPSPVKNSATSEGMPSSNTASFSEVLASEINGKNGMPEAKAASAGTGPETASGNIKIPAPASENPEDSANPGGSSDRLAGSSAKTQKNRQIKLPGEAASADTAATPATPLTGTSIINAAAITPQFADDTLPSLAGVHTPHIQAGTRTKAQIETATDTATDVQAGLAPVTIVNIDLGIIQLGLEPVSRQAASAPGAPGTLESNDIPRGSAIASSGAAGVLATAHSRAKHAAARQEELVGKVEANVKQAALQHMEFSFPQPGMGGEKLGKLQPETEAQPAIQPPAAMQMTSMLIPAEHAPVLAGAGAPVPIMLEPRLGGPDWGNALGQKVLWMVSSQQQVAELNLNPPDLGPLQVVLSISNDQASATFVSQHADVRQALEAALPRLREMMADSGINLGSATVSADSSQQQGFERQDRRSERYVAGGNPMGPGQADIGMSSININKSGKSRLVDIFA